jgi:CheY-like chemotaxis protein
MHIHRTLLAGTDMAISAPLFHMPSCQGRAGMMALTVVRSAKNARAAAEDTSERMAISWRTCTDLLRLRGWSIALLDERSVTLRHASNSSCVVVPLERALSGAQLGQIASLAGVPVRLFEQPSEPLTGLRILVVEDNADTRELFTYILEEAGGDVRTAADANEAVRALESEMADVLLTDIGLPGRDGYELRRVLTEKWGSAVPKSIAVTAWAAESDRQRARDAGFDEYVAKPVTPERLLAAVRHLAITK